MKLKLGLGFLLLSFFASSASADNCVWSVTGLSGLGSTMDVTYACNIGGSEAAVKTVGTVAVGSNSCAIDLNTGFYNNGTCEEPVITTEQPPVSGSKICEYNDPVIGDTPGCTRQSVGGGYGNVAYANYKDGVLLMYVTANFNNCTVSGTNNTYYVLGSCNNYRIYLK